VDFASSELLEDIVCASFDVRLRIGFPNVVAGSATPTRLFLVITAAADDPESCAMEEFTVEGRE